MKKNDKAFPDFKCNLQQYSLFSIVPLCTQNSIYIDEHEFLYYSRPMYLRKHGDTQFPSFGLFYKTPK